MVSKRRLKKLGHENFFICEPLYDILVQAKILQLCNDSSIFMKRKKLKKLLLDQRNKKFNSVNIFFILDNVAVLTHFQRGNENTCTLSLDASVVENSLTFSRKIASYRAQNRIPHLTTN